MIDNNKKAVIHIAKAQTGMSEVEYMDLLGSVGATSSTELTPSTFTQVMEHFEGMGFKKKTKKGKPASSKQRLLGKITALCLDMELSEEYAHGIAKRMFGIDHVRFCDAGQLWRITAALVYKQRKIDHAKAQRR